ncbi:MAG: cytochrome-c oxidase, cbb3-type subunit III [Rhizobiaceae bacterium]
MKNEHVDEVSGVKTTGHEWDGIKELNNPLPRWWVWTFYATIVWAIGYAIFYPAWPLINSATSGVLGYSSRQELNRTLDEVAGEQAERVAAIADRPLTDILADEELRRFAAAAGAAAYKVNCSQCHGSGAQGSPGYPNLNDDEWLWGGDVDSIHQTIAHGVRFAGDDETRYSEMPAFGEMLDRDQVRQAAAFVVSLSGEPSDPALASAGQQVFADNCAACHGENGEGSPDLGAPDLADAIWLYGSSEDAIAQQVRAPKHGVMPGWAQRLGDTTVKQLAVFVHSLGGGE